MYIYYIHTRMVYSWAAAFHCLIGPVRGQKASNECIRAREETRRKKVHVCQWRELPKIPGNTPRTIRERKDSEPKGFLFHFNLIFFQLIFTPTLNEFWMSVLRGACTCASCRHLREVNYSCYVSHCFMVLHPCRSKGGKERTSGASGIRGFT